MSQTQGVVLSMIMVQSTFKLNPESRESVMDLMKEMVRLCRKEHGCMSYEYYEGITDSCQVILLQEWKDAECLQEHYRTEHMADFLERLNDYLASPVTTRSYVSQESKISTPNLSKKRKPEQTLH